MHGDMTYVMHMMMQDEVDLQDAYEDYVKDKNIPAFEAEDNINYHAGVLEDKWDEFAQFLLTQGKSLEFNIESSQKLSWQLQQDLKNGLNADVQRRDHIIFGDADVKQVGGIKDFEISLHQLENLIDENFIVLEETQNDRPSTEEFLNFIKRFPIVKAIGFAVDLERADYRVSLDGLKYIGNIDDGFAYVIKNEWEETADEFELTEIYFRAWWD